MDMDNGSNKKIYNGISIEQLLYDYKKLSMSEASRMDTMKKMISYFCRLIYALIIIAYIFSWIAINNSHVRLYVLIGVLIINAIVATWENIVKSSIDKAMHNYITCTLQAIEGSCKEWASLTQNEKIKILVDNEICTKQ